MRIAMLCVVDVQVHEPPELIEHLRALARRLRRAAGPCWLSDVFVASLGMQSGAIWNILAPMEARSSRSDKREGEHPPAGGLLPGGRPEPGER